jgi:adenylylsulfate kinase-like enzyme
VIFDATANRRAYRDAARKSIARFAEAYVDTPLEVCAARDTKGLYRKGGTLPGVGAPYEAPLSPDVTLHGDRGSPSEAAATLVQFLEKQGWLSLAHP